MLSRAHVAMGLFRLAFRSLGLEEKLDATCVRKLSEDARSSMVRLERIVTEEICGPGNLLKASQRNSLCIFSPSLERSNCLEKKS